MGTPIQATDRSGIVVWSAQYSAFGRINITTPTATEDKPTISSSLRFPGQVEDAETGLYYNWHRYYDPEVDRYVTADPIGIKGGVNIYAYVGGNPVNLVDPLGLATFLGSEGHFVIGGGLTTVTCTDECGKEQTFRYMKVCIGGAAGGGFSAGVVDNMDGKSCRVGTYAGWFGEFGYTAPWGVSGSGDIGLGETDWKIPGLGVGLPFGTTGVNESGVGGGIPAGGKASFCYYIPI